MKLSAPFKRDEQSGKCSARLGPLSGGPRSAADGILSGGVCGVAGRPVTTAVLRPKVQDLFQVNRVAKSFSQHASVFCVDVVRRFSIRKSRSIDVFCLAGPDEERPGGALHEERSFMATAFVGECRQRLISAWSAQLGQPRTQEFHLVGTYFADHDSEHGVTVSGFAPTLAQFLTLARRASRGPQRVGAAPRSGDPAKSRREGTRLVACHPAVSDRPPPSAARAPGIRACAIRSLAPT